MCLYDRIYTACFQLRCYFDWCYFFQRWRHYFEISRTNLCPTLILKLCSSTHEFYIHLSAHVSTHIGILRNYITLSLYTSEKYTLSLIFFRRVLLLLLGRKMSTNLKLSSYTFYSRSFVLILLFAKLSINSCSRRRDIGSLCPSIIVLSISSTNQLLISRVMVCPTIVAPIPLWSPLLCPSRIRSSLLHEPRVAINWDIVQSTSEYYRFYKE